ncbi:unnamed protein product [Caenorhabditis bovis]|uniref:Uncharacterized protein n=1 Tax=Caenorhabditis bovis TaxID=2654633 RepID=A0A8S1FBZ9_9PELO|nr:unnamed protein product [Caenorhabditis bovis]
MASQACPSTPYVGTGIKQDLQSLYKKFADVSSLRIKDFAEVYRRNNFDKIYSRRISQSEYYEFAELLLQHAASYFREIDSVGEVRSLQQRIFGVYATYALYSTQPKDLMIPVRVTTTHVRELVTFQDEVSKLQLFDVVACIQNLIGKNAFQINRFQSAYDPAVHKKELVEDKNSESIAATVEPFEEMERTLNKDLFKELEYLHKTYVHVKKQLNLNQSGISLVDKRNPLEECQKIMEKFKNGLEASTSGTSSTEPSCSYGNEPVGTSRSNVRAKAYSAEMKVQRHRRYVDPGMEEPSQPKTFGDIARQLLAESEPAQGSSEGPSTTPFKEPKKQNKRKSTSDFAAGYLDDDAIAMSTLIESQTALLKRFQPEAQVENEEISKRRTIAAKVQAPKRKSNPNIREALEQTFGAMPSTSIPINLFDLPQSSSSNFEVQAGPSSGKNQTQPGPSPKPHMSIDWSARLKRMNQMERAADKTLEKIQSKVKLDGDLN